MAFKQHLEDDQSLEGRMQPILNPDGSDRQATEELIETLSTALDSPIAGDYAKDLIKAVKAGYEIQSGEKYEG